MTADPWMTTAEAAEYARLSVHTIYEAAEDGRLSGVKTTPGQKRSQWRFRKSNVDHWLERGRVAPVRPTVRRVS